MNKEDSTDCCYFHPKETVVGVCPLCLYDRLSVLAAAKQRHLSSSSSSSTSTAANSASSTAGRHKKKPSILFALGSLLEFRHPKSDLHDGPDYDDYGDASTGTLQDSFISIQFQDNGVASWEKGVDLISESKISDKKKKKKKKDDGFSWRNNKKKKNSQSHRRDPNKDTMIMPLSSSSSQSCGGTSYEVKEEEMMSVIEHEKARAGSMRWRKRIGHLIRWKRSKSRANVCHVGSKVEAVKVVSRNSSKGWIRTLTKRRARE